MKFKPLEKFDIFIIVSMLILSGLGISFIYSSGIDSTGLLQKHDYTKQIAWASVGFIMMLVTAIIDYRRLKRFLKFLAPAIILLLAYTMKFGQKLNGARSWIGIGPFGIQPSEFCKLVYICFLAWYLEKSKKDSDTKRFIFAVLIMVVPMGLILLQPDFGTAIVYIPIFLFMCLIAGIPLRYLLGIFSVGVLTILLTVLPVWETEIYQKTIPAIRLLTNKRLFLVVIATLVLVTAAGLLGYIYLKKSYFYWIAFVSAILLLGCLGSMAGGKFLKEYQIKRLIIFIDPNVDPQGTGWNIINSQIAIGSGGLKGKGFLMGTQSHYRFLPEQSTDFIFSILSEESGFLGGMVVFLAYLTILFRIIRTMRKINDPYGIYICAGILGMLFFHFLINVGMVMGMMPITGIPLPFVSYGGSAYLTNAIAMGLVMSARSRRLDFTVVY